MKEEKALAFISTQSCKIPSLQIASMNISFSSFPEIVKSHLLEAKPIQSLENLLPIQCL